MITAKRKIFLPFVAISSLFPSCSYLPQPTTTFHNPPLPATTHHYLPQPTTTSHNAPLPATTHHYLPQPTTTSHNPPLPATTHQYQPQRTTTSHNPPHRYSFKFVFITWIGSAVRPLDKAAVSGDKAFVKDVFKVRALLSIRQVPKIFPPTLFFLSRSSPKRS